MLNKIGNAVANRIYEADLHLMSGWTRPTAKGSTTEDLKRYIRAKYEHRGFVDQVVTKVFIENEDGAKEEKEMHEGEEKKGGNQGDKGNQADKGGARNKISKREVIREINCRMIDASRNNDVAEMLYCLAHGADINCADDINGNSALHYACEHGLEALTFGILNGGKLEQMNCEGLSCLDIAMINDKTEAMEICLSRMKTPNRPVPTPPSSE